MQAREWEHVVRALVHLGCTVFAESDAHIALARGASLFQNVPKRPLSPAIQRHLIGALGLSQVDYEQALAETRADG